MAVLANLATFRQIDLPRAPGSASIARRFIEQHFACELSPRALADAKLATTELVTNAVTHGRGAVMLKVEASIDRLRVEVIDQGTGRTPEIRHRPGDESGGWGLRIVDALSLRWGAVEGSTHVWADLPKI